MKIALGIEYNGKQYCGWQRQEKVRSVQEELEKAGATFIVKDVCELENLLLFKKSLRIF